MIERSTLVAQYKVCRFRGSIVPDGTASAVITAGAEVMGVSLLLSFSGDETSTPEALLVCVGEVELTLVEQHS